MNLADDIGPWNPDDGNKKIVLLPSKHREQDAEDDL